MTAAACASCATELPLDVLACPACGVLLHAETLKTLAAEANAATASGEWTVARDRWNDALALLPAASQQHAAIRGRLDAINRRLAETPAPRVESSDGRWWSRGVAGLLSLLFLTLGKLKFLLLGLTKISTVVSMFAFLGVYWSSYGWPLAAGLVLSIYIHEMGHVSMLRRLGISAGAPLFIPGLGALVMLKQHVSDPHTDAKIGLAGPVWGLGAALAALAVFAVTRIPIFLAIAQLTGFMNLFNLIPVWQLDGSRGFHALSRAERWLVVAAIAVALWLTGQRLLIVIGAVALWRTMERTQGPGDTRALATFTLLVLSLSFLSLGLA